MNFEALEKAWASQANTLTPAAETYVLEQTMQTLKSRRKGFTHAMGLIGLCLIGWTVLMVYTLLFGGVIDLRREWGLLLMMAVPWGPFLMFQARYRRHMRAFPDPEQTMPEALSALIDENRTRQARAKLMLIGLPVFVVVMGVVLWQMVQVGKMEPRHVLEGSILFGGALLASAVIQAVIFFTRTRPEGERLKRLLSDYQQ